jgi:hypothetical protein
MKARQLQPFKQFAKFFKTRIGGYQGCLIRQRQYGRITVRIAQFISMFESCSLDRLACIDVNHGNSVLESFDILKRRFFPDKFQENIVNFSHIDSRHGKTCLPAPCLFNQRSDLFPFPLHSQPENNESPRWRPKHTLSPLILACALRFPFGRKRLLQRVIS